MDEIMVLDDVLDAAIMIKRILERQGSRVAVFTDEEEPWPTSGPTRWRWPFWISDSKR